MTALVLLALSLALVDSAAVDPTLQPIAVESAQAKEAGVQPASTVVIPDGTMIELELAETISTRTHVKGDTFELLVTKAVLADGHEVLSVGTKVIGEITRAETKSAFGISGKLEARLLYAVLPSRTMRLVGKIGARGKGGTTETILTYAAIGAIAFVVTGKSATIEKGSKLVGVIGQ